MAALPIEAALPVETVHPSEPVSRYLLVQFKEPQGEDSVNVEITTEGITPGQDQLKELLKVVLDQLENTPTQ